MHVGSRRKPGAEALIMSGIHAGVMTTSLELIRAQHVPLKEVTESFRNPCTVGKSKEAHGRGGARWILVEATAGSL